MVYNERSLYRIPGTRTLALLLRGGGHNLSVALCNDLPAVKTVQPDQTLFSCRPGVGDAFMNLIEVVSEGFRFGPEVDSPSSCTLPR